MGCLPGIQGFFGFYKVREVMALAIDFLIVLVTFAGQHDHIVCTGTSNDLRDGRATPCDKIDAFR